jgi:hypothetical protein
MHIIGTMHFYRDYNMQIHPFIDKYAVIYMFVKTITNLKCFYINKYKKIFTCNINMWCEHILLHKISITIILHISKYNIKSKTINFYIPGLNRIWYGTKLPLGSFDFLCLSIYFPINCHQHDLPM